MSRWWRAYDEAVDDPKLCLLSDRQHRAWFNLCCIASQNDGRLPPIAAVAFKLRMTVQKAKSMVAELVALRLIDMDETGVCQPHNWNERQYKTDITDPTTAKRSKNYRDRKRDARRDDHRDAAVTVTGTRAETETDTDTDTEQSRDKKPRAVALDDDWPEDFGDQFWQAYPRKTEKLAAMKKLASVRKSRVVAFVDLMAGVRRYAAANLDPQYTKHPTTWLNAGCWADETQAGGRNGSGNLNSPRRSASSDFFAGIAGVAADIAGDHPAPRDAGPEVPLGRVNIDG